MCTVSIPLLYNLVVYVSIIKIYLESLLLTDGDKSLEDSKFQLSDDGIVLLKLQESRLLSCERRGSTNHLYFERALQSM